jgi:hypothetical protein
MEKPQLFIFVMERGFVLIGRPEKHKFGDAVFEYTLSDCAVIRQWGTTDGLGQIAFSGPTSETVFDREPDGTVINRRAIYRKIPCGDWSDNWKP